MAKKRQKKKETEYITISRKNFIMLIVGVFVVVAAYFPITNYLQEKKIQADCPQNFYKFENDYFSVCYPKDMKASTYRGKTVDDRETENVKFSNNQREYEIFPRFQFGHGMNKCMHKESVELANGTVERLVARSEVGSECGEISSIYSSITNKQNNSWVYLFETSETTDFDQNEYYTIESSINIK